MPNDFDTAANAPPERPSWEAPQYTDKDYADARLERVETQQKLDLKELVMNVTHQLAAIQKHYFLPSGEPKKTTDAAAIGSYMRTNLQLLTMLQKFEEALATDDDFRKVELALEMTFEDMQVPNFQETFHKYLEQQ